MKFLLRLVLVLLATAAAAALGIICSFVLLLHFLPGGNSPSILAIAKDGLRTWIPLVAALLALWLLGTCARVVLLARRRASAAGITLLQYFALTPEQRSQLSGSHTVGIW